MKVLFVINEISYADHIALAYLSAVAKKLGHDTYLCVLTDKDLASVIKELKPEVVAYSANIMGFDNICRQNQRALLEHNFISILGGPQATFSPSTFEHSGMDAYFIGEGELAFEDFLIKVEKGEPFDDIPNLITKNRINEVIPLIEDIDQIPFPDRDLTLNNTFLKNIAKKTFYATRGCPFNCSYCCNNYYQELYRGKGKVVRRFSVGRLIQEMEDVKGKYRMDFVKMGDDLFAYKADSWLEEFAKEYAKRIRIPFNCYLRIDMVDDDLLKLLKEAGCYSVHLSIDSTSAHVRNNILKRRMKLDNQQLVNNLNRIHSYGINTWVNYMLAAPESMLEDDLASIKISKLGNVTYSAYSTTVPMVGTGLYEYAVEKGLINPTEHVGDMAGCYQRSTLKCFSEKEKNIRYNIFLLGAVISKLPRPFDSIAIKLIKHVPPNQLFRLIRDKVYKFNIENKIFYVKD